MDSPHLLEGRFEVQVLMTSRCTLMLHIFGCNPVETGQKTNFEVLKIKLVKINLKEVIISCVPRRGNGLAFSKDPILVLEKR